MLALAAPIFIKNGFELHALSTGENRGSYSEILENAGYKVHHIPFKKNPKYFWDLYKLFKKEKFEIVHIHPERAFVWHAIVAKISRVKIIVRTVHNIFNFKGVLRIRKYFARWFARNIIKVKFHAVSDSVALIEKENFNNQATKIYNWIDEIKFYPLENVNDKFLLREKLRIREDSFAIISVGACSSVKRHNMIIEALNKIIKKVENVVYLHLGDGPQLNEEIQLAEKYGLNKSIIFAGQKENIRDYLAASDVFVMVSEYEGLGNASLEALFCGLPLIVTNTYGLREVVINNYNGLLISNTTDLSEAILEFYNSPNKQKEFSKNSIKLAHEKFSMEKSVNELIELYKR